MSTGQLLRSLASEASHLIGQQFLLAQLESQRLARQEKSTLIWAAVGALLFCGALATFASAAIIALGRRLGGRNDLAALLVGAGLLAGAIVPCLLAWRKFVRVALPASRVELAKEIEWVKTRTP